MTVSAASNALIISDTESKLEVLRQLLDGVDLEVPQVQIEARIVQADTTYTRSLGVQWGIQTSTSWEARAERPHSRPGPQAASVLRYRTS